MNTVHTKKGGVPGTTPNSGQVHSTQKKGGVPALNYLPIRGGPLMCSPNGINARKFNFSTRVGVEGLYDWG